MAEIIACGICGQAHQVERGEPAAGMRALCVRCGSAIERRSRGSLQLTAAFSLAALLLYVPANLFPILRLSLYGATQDSTVWQGCVRFWQAGDFVIAAIVFLASIFIPLLKLLGLFFLVTTTRLHWGWGKFVRTWIYRVINSLGRWAMLDVFVLGILVSLVKLRSLATVIAGKGALAFALVVVCTLLASACFDPQLIWDHNKQIEEPAL
jgi:paraquat-inducible protein A